MHFLVNYSKINWVIKVGRYYSLNEYLQEQFGTKAYKLSVDIGCTCPNRDGTKDTRGCIFCHNGSSHFAETGENIDAQLENAKNRVRSKINTNKFIAYFQSFTNTYGDFDYLKNVFTRVIERDDIIAISIGTRPDCLPESILSLLEELNKIKPVWVELGLQSSKDETVKYIRRCYPNSVYESAVKSLKSRGITVITHIIIGLPHESRQDVLNTVNFAVKCGTDGVKLQLLHILRGTDLHKDYIENKVPVLTLEEYMNILFDCIEAIPKSVVIHRITGDAPKKYLVAPQWSGDKKRVLNTINKEMEKRDIIQGKCVL